MKNIAWLGAAIPGRGGPFVHVSHWAKHIDKSKYRVTLIFSSPEEIRSRVKDLSGFGIEVIFMPELSDLKTLYLPSVFKLSKLLREREIELLHTVLTRSDVLGPLAAKIAGVPHVVSSIEGKLISSHGIPSRWRRVAYRLGYRYSKQQIDRFIAISSKTKTDHCREFRINPDKIVVVHNGVEPDRFDYKQCLAASQQRCNSNAHVLGYFGVLGRHKGVDTIIEALPLILERYPNTSLLLVGEGNDTPLFQQRVRELKLEDNVVFSPWRQEVSGIMEAFDVFILPSQAEGMPWAVLEAMASAKPVIATAVGGIPEAVVDGETGILLSNSKPETIARAVLSMLDSPERMLQMGCAGRRRIEDCFTVSIEMRKIEALYDSLTEDREDFLQGPR
ncbi:MAG: glycosyltransferase [Actinobacteria bacterium]|nr:glycosyltransferase [Actinomycetota bacterium]